MYKSVSGEFPAQRPVMRSFDVFLRLVICDAIAHIMTSLQCLKSSQTQLFPHKYFEATNKETNLVSHHWYSPTTSFFSQKAISFESVFVSKRHYVVNLSLRVKFIIPNSDMVTCDTITIFSNDHWLN